MHGGDKETSRWGTPQETERADISKMMRKHLKAVGMTEREVAASIRGSAPVMPAGQQPGAQYARQAPPPPAAVPGAHGAVHQTMVPGTVPGQPRNWMQGTMPAPQAQPGYQVPSHHQAPAQAPMPVPSPQQLQETYPPAPMAPASVHFAPPALAAVQGIYECGNQVQVGDVALRGEDLLRVEGVLPDGRIRLDAPGAGGPMDVAVGYLRGCRLMRRRR